MRKALSGWTERGHMGILRTEVVIHSPDEGLAETVILIVDTGSTLTWIDAKALRRMGYRPRERRLFQTIRGIDVRKPVGDAVIEWQGIRASVGVVFAAPKEGKVLGVTALERLGLEIDPVKPALRKARAFLALSAS